MNSAFRRNLFILIAIGISVLNLAVFAGARLILSDSFAQLEQASVKENIQRAKNAVKNDLDDLGTLCTNWSFWDDTYAFIAERNFGYVKSKLVDSTFTELNLDAILFFDANGALVFGRAMDLVKEVGIEVPTDLLAGLARHKQLWAPESGVVEVDGILNVSGGPIILSARSILTSQGEGPSRGPLVMVRRFNAQVLAQLSERTSLSLTSELITGGQITQGDQPIVEVDPGKPAIIWGHYPLAGIDGNPVLTLSVMMNREVYRQVRRRSPISWKAS